MTKVRIADLLASSPVDPTAHLDPDRVRRYAELAGDLPPVIAFRTDQGLILADGYHRVAAAHNGWAPATMVITFQQPQRRDRRQLSG